MKTKNIKIIGITDVTRLAQKAYKVNGDVYLKKGIYVVDGKSLMGIMSIDVSTGVTVTYPEDAIEFDQFISTFED